MVLMISVWILKSILLTTCTSNISHLIIILRIWWHVNTIHSLILVVLGYLSSITVTKVKDAELSCKEQAVMLNNSDLLCLISYFLWSWDTVLCNSCFSPTRIPIVWIWTYNTRNTEQWLMSSWPGQHNATHACKRA